MSTLKVNPVMYLLAEAGNPMSAGKFAAQAAHAAVNAYCASPDDRLRHIWEACGNQHPKVVLQCDDLVVAQEYIEARGFITRMVIDEGRTEFDGGLTRTFLGVQIVDKNRADVAATFSGFKLYREPRVEAPAVEEKRSFIHRCKERISAYRPRRGS